MGIDRFWRRLKRFQVPVISAQLIHQLGEEDCFAVVDAGNVVVFWDLGGKKCYLGDLGSEKQAEEELVRQFLVLKWLNSKCQK